jgi:hypothetical protein
MILAVPLKGKLFQSNKIPILQPYTPVTDPKGTITYVAPPLDEQSELDFFSFALIHRAASSNAAEVRITIFDTTATSGTKMSR